MVLRESLSAKLRPTRGEKLFQSIRLESLPANLTAGHEVRERLVALDLAAEVLRRLLVPAHAEVEREAVLREDVAEVGADVLAAVLGEAVAPHVGDLVVGGVDDAREPVAAVSAAAGRLQVAIAEAELQLVAAAHARGEVVAVDVEHLLRPDRLVLLVRADRLAHDVVDRVGLVHPAAREERRIRCRSTRPSPRRRSSARRCGRPGASRARPAGRPR